MELLLKTLATQPVMLCVGTNNRQLQKDQVTGSCITPFAVIDVQLHAQASMCSSSVQQQFLAQVSGTKR